MNTMAENTHNISIDLDEERDELAELPRTRLIDVSTMETAAEGTHNLSLGLSERRDELAEILRTRLIECGWRDQVASMCRKIIEEQGVEQVKIGDILSGVKAEARNQIPQGVKSELVGQIRKMRKGHEREAKSSVETVSDCTVKRSPK